jgi:hypothetical protein
MAPTPQENLLITERILRLKEKIVALEEQEAELTEEQSEELIKAELQLAKILKFNEKRLKLTLGTATAEAELSSTIKGQISDVSSLSSIYNGLKQTNIATLRSAQQSLATVQKGLLQDENKKAILESTLDGVSKLQEIQRQIAESGPDEVEKQEALRESYKFQESLLRDTLSVKQDNAELTKEEFDALEKILDSQMKGLDIAQKYGTISAETKEIIQGQLDAYKAVGKTIRGVVGTARVLMSTPGGILGATLIGAGKLVGKLGEVNKELGTTFSDMNIQGGLTALIFDDYVDNVRALNKELGSASESQGSLARNMSEIAQTFGVAGPEAASLVGSFSRLNGNSESVALDMMATSREFARQNNLIPGALMSDIAGSAEAFALYGKDGGKNILEAAGYAQKLGVEMSTIQKVTDSLLDFETSITKELELGAMLGRNINLDRARALAYEDDMAGAVRATLDELGGIEEFNKMDRYAKIQTAELLGLSVQEFQKMNALQAQGNDLSKINLETFNETEVAAEGLTNVFGGKFLEFLGAGAIAMGQIGLQIRTNTLLSRAFNAQQQMSSMTPTLGGGITQGVDRRGRSFTRGANGRFMRAPAPPPGPPPGPSNVNNMGGGINMKSVLQGAAAMLILAGAMFVFAKAAQEFGDGVKWDQVFIGIGAMATLGVVAGVLGIGPIATAVGIGTGLILGLSGAFFIFATGALIMATAVTMIANALPLLANGISSLVPMIGGIFGLAGAFTALGFSLAVLGSMGLIALPVLLGIGAAAAGLGLLFGALGVGDSTGGIEGGSLSEYESTMLNKMDSLIQAVSSNRDVYLDTDKVTSLVMQRSDRSIVNKLNIFNA